MPKDGESLNAFPCTIGSVDSVDAIVEKAKTLHRRELLWRDAGR